MAKRSLVGRGALLLGAALTLACGLPASAEGRSEAGFAVRESPIDTGRRVRGTDFRPDSDTVRDALSRIGSRLSPDFVARAMQRDLSSGAEAVTFTARSAGVIIGFVARNGVPYSLTILPDGTEIRRDAEDVLLTMGAELPAIRKADGSRIDYGRGGAGQPVRIQMPDAPSAQPPPAAAPAAAPVEGQQPRD